MLPSQTHCTHACSPGWAVVALGLATPRRSAPARPASGFRAAHSALGRPAPYFVSCAVRIGSPTGDAWLTSSVLAKVPDSTLHQSGGYRCHRRWRRNVGGGNPTAATVSQSYPLRVSVAPAHRAVGFSVSPHFHPHIRWVPSLDIVAQHPPVILHLSPLGHGAGVQRHPR